MNLFLLNLILLKKLQQHVVFFKDLSLGPFLFLVYLNDLHHASKVLNPIMFADNTNLSHGDINLLFEKINRELMNVSNWFNANKLLLNPSQKKLYGKYTSSIL